MEDLNPRWMAYIAVTPAEDVSNIDYMCWITRLATKYKALRGVVSVIDQDDFTEFVQGQV